MAKFRVKYKSIGYVYLDVEADTLEDAKEIAKNTDGGEFIESGVGDWEYDHTEDENGNLIEAAYWLEEQSMNELYINDSIIYFKTNAKNYDKAMDEFIEACDKADIDITIENACLRDENGDEVDE